MSDLRILHITHWFPSVENPVCGIFIKEYCDAVHQENPESGKVIFIDITMKSKRAFPKISLFSYKSDTDIEVVRVNIDWFLGKLVYIYAQLQWMLIGKRLKKLVEDINPGIIHSHVVHPSGAIGYKIAKACSKPMVITEHWSNLPAYFSNPLRSLLGRKAYNYSKFILPVSRFLHDMIINYVSSDDQNKVIVVPNVVNEKIFRFTSVKNFDSKQIRFIAIATWNRYRNMPKRPDIMIKSLSAFKQETGRDVSLTIVGDGNMIEDIKQIAAEHNLPLACVGRKSKQEISEMFTGHDFFIHASDIETFSIVTAEALMVGLPAIVSNTGALPELVTPERGVTCENNVEAWVSGLKVLTNRSFDREQISAEISEICSFQNVGRKIGSIYSTFITVAAPNSRD